MSIETVLGSITIEEITGPVLPHEHLMVDLRTTTDRSGVLGTQHAALVAAELTQARTERGLSLVVDQTCRGMGRNATSLQAIARESQVPVVASTGWYYERFHPAGEPGTDVDSATAVLVTELNEGIDGTTVRAGVIGEVGTHSETPSPAERVSLLAAGAAALATGRPVATHAHLGTGALAQLEVLAETGVPLSQVCVGHQDLIDDPRQHAAIATSGAFVGFDTVGKSSYQLDSVRLRLVLALLEHGLGAQLLLSNDISRHGYLSSEGGQGYGHVLGPFADQLRAAGVDGATLFELYHTNPVRWLAGSAVVARGSETIGGVAR